MKAQESKLEELIKFPCNYEVKIMGVNNDEFINQVIAILTKHDDKFNHAHHLKHIPSAKGNYLSLRANIYALNKAHLEALYLELNQHPLVKITL